MKHKIFQKGYEKGNLLFIGMDTARRNSWEVYGDSYQSIYYSLCDNGVIGTDEPEAVEVLGYFPTDEPDFLTLILQAQGNAYYQSIYRRYEDGYKLVYSNWEKPNEDTGNVC